MEWIIIIRSNIVSIFEENFNKRVIVERISEDYDDVLDMRKFAKQESIVLNSAKGNTIFSLTEVFQDCVNFIKTFLYRKNQWI